MALEHYQVPEIGFVVSRGARIAYQVIGNGAAPIVSIPPMAQNIEMAWEWPAVRAMFDRFSSFSTFVHFDKLGTGSSDRHRGVNDVDARVDDVAAVMDAAGLARAHFFVTSEGGPLAVLFAAAFPDRVISLVLNGTFAWLGDMSDDERSTRLQRNAEFAARWGTPDSEVVDLFAPSLAGDDAFRSWHQRYERAAASPESLKELLRLSLDVDVREVLPDLDVPTLVTHRVGDRVVPIELGRHLAAAIPGAEIVEQEGVDHFNYAGDMDGWMDDVERFITGSVSPRTTSRSTVRPSVQIVTLGRFAVLADGVEVPVSEWGSRRARQLCKRLVAARGWPVRREELIDLLWPDETDLRRLAARLSVQLSGVRRVLDGGIAADRDTVRLDLDQVSTDLEDLYAAETDEAVVSAYAGEFLPGDVYDDWTLAPRGEARTRFALAAVREGKAALVSGDADRAATMAHRLIEADPYSDAGHRMLVQSLVASGQQREAERAYEMWVSAVSEIGMDAPELDEVI